MTSLGLDIGGSSIKAAAVDGDRVVWTNRSASYARPDRATLTAALRDVTAGRSPETQAIGLCVPGLMDDAKQRVVESVNVPGLVGQTLCDLLLEAGMTLQGDPVVVGDAYATAFDLFATRELEGRLFVLAIGTGVGAAVLDDGRPLFVDGESPGHFGQLDVSLPGEPAVGPDGGAGSLEGYLGAAALQRRYGVEKPAEHIQPNDPAIIALVRAIRIAHGLYRPRHVILAGGIGNRLARMKDAIDEAVRRQLTRIARPDWTLGFGDSDFHAAAGAARLAARGGW